MRRTTVSERALVLAPRGRDATLASAMLREAGLAADASSSLTDLILGLDHGAGLVVITEEALATSDLAPLAAWIRDQQEWSDMPFVLLTSHGGGLERNPTARRYLDILGNVTFLERPFHPTTLVSLAEAALRGRRRQYEARARLEALTESEERLRLATEAAEVGFWDMDPAGRTLIGSSRMKAMFGLPVEGTVRLDDFYAGLHPDDVGAASDAFAAAADPNRRSVYDVEYRVVASGSALPRWIAAKGRGLFDARGTCLRVLGTALDVTERKRVEAELRDLNENLERRVRAEVADRARAEEQLRQSQKMEAMGQLTGGVAHDFNNLLTPIIGSLDRLVSRELGTERERRLMAGALESAERAKTLVQRLLAFARRQPLQPVAVDVGAVVNGMADLLRSTLGPTIDLAVAVEEDLPPALADANQLEMALLNLAVNARDAMPEGGRLSLAASRGSVRHGQRSLRDPGHGPGEYRSELDPGHYVRLAVADTGSGMDAATLARAIEPFFSTKGIGKGTGLGLSMVHGLMAQLGGALTVQSEPGAGTTVELWLPLSDRPLDDAHARDLADGQSLAGRGRALLVDDEELVRMSTADMLADLGFDVLEACSAEEALMVLQREESIDLLVTDHLMPGMSGVALAREARSLRGALPVLIVSGYAEAEDLAPDIPRLVKPFRVADLAEQVAAVLAVAR